MTQDELKAILNYSPDTGVFVWLINRRQAKSKKGEVAGTKHSGGYLQITVNRQLYLAHRLAWLYVFGENPASDLKIDHANGDKSDNRILNLRLATHSQNICNVEVKRNNTSGAKGVFWSKRRQKWFVLIIHQKVRHSFGFFTDFDQAKLTAIAKRKELHDEFARD